MLNISPAVFVFCLASNWRGRCTHPRCALSLLCLPQEEAALERVEALAEAAREATGARIAGQWGAVVETPEWGAAARDT